MGRFFGEWETLNASSEGTLIRTRGLKSWMVGGEPMGVSWGVEEKFDLMLSRISWLR